MNNQSDTKIDQDVKDFVAGFFAILGFFLTIAGIILYPFYFLIRLIGKSTR